ncbi:MAG TPA: cupin domain-containing protein [Terriglobia bacterium]|nr:cupin domain-containing protein [Terriglobia bacterium]
MKMHPTVAGLLVIISIVVLSHASFSIEADKAGLHPKVVKLDSAGKDYLQVLGGPPESVTMKSGLVVLAPNKSVGKHSTKQHEELLVILEGQGEMIFKDGSTLQVKANHALYCPPETEHDVRNTGTHVLRYVYIVADAK